MKKNNSKKKTRHPIEAAIIAHIARYGVTTAEALLAVEMKGVQEIKQAEERLRAMVRKGDLVEHRQLPDEPCFTFSSQAHMEAKACGFPSALRIRSLDSLARAYALLAFCCLGPQQRKLLTTTELAAHVSGLRQPAQRRSYYLSREDNQLRLGFIRVDAGGHGRWDRIAHKACDDMRKHLAIASLRPLIDKHEFEICVLTALPDKTKKIETLLAEQQKQLPVAYRVVSVPQLINFLRPRPD